MLAARFRDLLETGWSDVFARSETRQRAIDHAMALPASFSPRTISRTIAALGRAYQGDWSAEYKMFSRSPWETSELFDPVFDVYLKRYPNGPIVAALDDTGLEKSGTHIPHVGWQRDPLSPPFRANLRLGLRFLQISLIFPHHSEGDWPARAIPVRFEQAPVIKKPSKKATDQERQEFKKLRKQTNLSTRALATVQQVRERLALFGARRRTLILVADGSFCNRTFFGTPIDQVILVARARKDARLCRPAAAGSRRTYDTERFTPETIRKDDGIPYRTTTLYIGGQWREVEYKEVTNVLWKRGSGSRPVRVLVLAPQPYHCSPNGKKNYRHPAYLLTTDLELPASMLLQAYVDRWQIEINHRDEKSLFGVGEAQVWSKLSTPRHPAFVVACYSMLLLAALLEFGPDRTDDYPLLPAWRTREPNRASALDILSRFRMDLETFDSAQAPGNIAKNLVVSRPELIH